MRTNRGSTVVGVIFQKNMSKFSLALKPYFNAYSQKNIRGRIFIKMKAICENESRKISIIFYNLLSSKN